MALLVVVAEEERHTFAAAVALGEFGAAEVVAAEGGRPWLTPVGMFCCCLKMIVVN